MIKISFDSSLFLSLFSSLLCNILNKVHSVVLPGVAVAVVAPTWVTPAFSDMALARMVARVSRLNPVAILDGNPLILATVKRIVREELLSFFESQQATCFRSSVLREVVVGHI